MLRSRWITLDELEDRRAEWHRLAANSEFPAVYTDPGWILPWWREYGKHHDPWCLALEDSDGPLRGLALLACRRTPFTRTLTFAGGNWNGLESLLCAPDLEPEISALLLDELAARRQDWDVWRVGRMPADSHLAQRLLDGRGPLRVSAHDFRFQPFLDLPDDVPAYESRYGSKHQRRNWRRLLALGASPHLVREPEEIEPVIRELIAMRRARANRKGQRQAHMDPRFERFLIDAVCALIPDGARLWTLEVEEQTLAVCLNLVEGPREHGYLLGLGDSHTSLSPGTLLKRHALLEAIADGRRELDLGPGRDESKYRLGAIDRKLTRLIVVNSSPRARISSARATIDLKLRNTAAADALRRRRGIVSERATAGSGDAPPLAAK